MSNKDLIQLMVLGVFVGVTFAMLMFTFLGDFEAETGTIDFDSGPDGGVVGCE